jgi:hypothetical protein
MLAGLRFARAVLRFSPSAQSHHRISSMSTAPTAATNSAKRVKMGKKIGTHSGTFHCDEALGCYLLQQTSKYAGAEIVRTRDPAVLAELDVVIDVGGVYDPGTESYFIIRNVSLSIKYLSKKN